MEEWKDIPGYEGLYQVSNKGRVKSLKFGEKILKCSPTGGYNKVILYKNKSVKGFKIHRLVASLFIPNPNNKSEVNHKDGNGLNNDINNLEWVTNKENIFHSRNITKNGAVISMKRILHLYEGNRNISTEEFVKKLLNLAN